MNKIKGSHEIFCDCSYFLWVNYIKIQGNCWNYLIPIDLVGIYDIIGLSELIIIINTNITEGKNEKNQMEKKKEL